MADTHTPEVATIPRLPVEVCERIVEAVYDSHYHLVRTALTTLSNCALVCRAWRPRAQRILFQYVILRDKDALYQFGKLLDVSPELGGYVRSLQLRGHLHVPYSPVVLFPSVLRGRLDNLSGLFIIEPVSDHDKALAPLPEGLKELPTLPIHQYLPSLLTCVSHIHVLQLTQLRFSSFGECARILNALPNVRSLWCGELTWAVFGQEPPCMKIPHSHGSQHTFLPVLRWFSFLNMDAQGTQRVVSALGPSLREMQIAFPNAPRAAMRSQDRAVEDQHVTPPALQVAPLALDLNRQTHSHLTHLYFILQHLQPDDSALGSLRDTLASFVTAEDNTVLGSEQVSLEPSWKVEFTRKEFIELLRLIGPTVEAALCSQQPPAALGHDAGEETRAEEANPCRATLVIRGLGDHVEYIEYGDWWRARIAECFPTLSRWNRLSLDSINPKFPTQAPRWIDQVASPLRVQDHGQDHVRNPAQDSAQDSVHDPMQDHHIVGDDEAMVDIVVPHRRERSDTLKMFISNLVETCLALAKAIYGGLYRQAYMVRARRTVLSSTHHRYLEVCSLPNVPAGRRP